jgi:hypothetical protein
MSVGNSVGFLRFSGSDLNRKNDYSIKKFKHSKNRTIYKESMCIEKNSLQRWRKSNIKPKVLQL